MNKIKRPGQSWISVLNIILIDGSDLKAMDSNGLSDPYVKIKMDNEKYRSKVYNKIIIKSLLIIKFFILQTIRRTLNPKFNEQFLFYVYDNNKMILNLIVYDHDDYEDDFIILLM